MAKIKSLHDLFIEQLKDLYSAETQLIKALPKMAEAAHAPALKNGFEEHLEQTREHAHRLEEILEKFDEKTDRQQMRCDGRPDQRGEKDDR